MYLRFFAENELEVFNAKHNRVRNFELSHRVPLDAILNYVETNDFEFDFSEIFTEKVKEAENLPTLSTVYRSKINQSPADRDFVIDDIVRRLGEVFADNLSHRIKSLMIYGYLNCSATFVELVV